MRTCWSDLPEEIWRIIVKYSGVRSWSTMRLVNSCFYNMVLQQEKLSRRNVCIRCPKKLSRKMWNRLRGRPVIRLNLEKCSHANLGLVLGKLSNIVALKLHVDNLTESTTKCITSYNCLPLLQELDFGFSQAHETSLHPLKMLANSLHTLRLKGSFEGSCQGFTKELFHLKKIETLHLDVQWLKTGMEWDLARVAARKLGEVICALPALKHLGYRFEAHCNYEALLAASDVTPLRKLKSLHLEKAIFNSAPTYLRHMTNLESLTLVDCLSMISHHSNFFEGMSSLKELTLRHVEDSPNILSHLPTTLTKISLRSMTSTKGFSMYLKNHGRNIEHLELDGVFEINCMLVESFPSILPNLKTFHYRHNYYEFGTVMSFLKFKRLTELDMTGCTGNGNVDNLQLKEMVKTRTDSKLLFRI